MKQDESPQYLDPAATVFRRIGGGDDTLGIKIVERVTGMTRRQLRHWREPKKRGGTGGKIPRKHHDAILNSVEARHHGIERADLEGT